MECPHLFDLMESWRRVAPDELCASDVRVATGDTERTHTFDSFLTWCRVVADSLSERAQVWKTRNVLAQVSPGSDALALFFACRRLGLTLVPVAPSATTAELERIAGVSHPDVYWKDDEFKTLRAKVAAKSREQDFRSVRLPQEVRPQEYPALLLFTSGSTGIPKPVYFSEEQIFWNAWQTMVHLDLVSSDKTLTHLPLYHTGGWNVLTLPLVLRGGHVLFDSRCNLECLAQFISQEKITIFFSVPTVLKRIVLSPSFDSADFSQLRCIVTGGESIPLEVIELWHGKGVSVRQGYGLTEFGPNVFSLRSQDAKSKPGSIGKPNLLVEATLIDQEGRKGATLGELALRGPVAGRLEWRKGALGTLATDEWLRTGDLCRKDADGFYFVEGRLKDIYISGGENVAPKEVEHALRKCPGVKDVAVVGVPSERWGETGLAAVVWDSNASPTVAALKKTVSGSLTRYKHPEFYVFLEELPVAHGGKVLRRQIQQMWNEGKLEAVTL